MKLYIAAPWNDRKDVPAIAEKFEQAGHEITHKWWLSEEVGEKIQTPEKEAEHRGHAFADMNGVIDAQVVILINSSKSEGKATESGIAIANRKPIIAVGKRGQHSSNVFHYLPNFKWVDTVDDALLFLKPIQWVMDASQLV